MIREMIREGEEQRVDVDEQQGVSLWSAASSSVITGDVLTEELQCGICIGPAFDPVRSICCRTLFCRVCISQAIDCQHRCPCCRAEILSSTNLEFDARVEKQLSTRSQDCPYKYFGCNYTGMHLDVDSHLLVCDWIPRSELRKQLASVEEENNTLRGNLLKLNLSSMSVIDRLRSDRDEAIRQLLIRMNDLSNDSVVLHAQMHFITIQHASIVTILPVPQSIGSHQCSVEFSFLQRPLKPVVDTLGLTENNMLLNVRVNKIDSLDNMHCQFPPDTRTGMSTNSTSNSTSTNSTSTSMCTLFILSSNSAHPSQRLEFRFNFDSNHHHYVNLDDVFSSSSINSSSSSSSSSNSSYDKHRVCRSSHQTASDEIEITVNHLERYSYQDRIAIVMV